MTLERTLKTVLIVGNDALTLSIGKIKAAGKKLDTMIQVTGVSVLNHIEDCGDITQFEALWAAMPMGSRKNALAEWAVTYGKLSINKDANTKAVKPFLFDRDKKTDLFGAEDTQWFMFKPEKPVDESFDFAKLIAMMMSKADKAEQQGTPIVGSEALKAVRTALATLPTVAGTAVEA